jgi:hypothetical protein
MGSRMSDQPPAARPAVLIAHQFQSHRSRDPRRPHVEVVRTSNHSRTQADRGARRCASMSPKTGASGGTPAVPREKRVSRPSAKRKARQMRRCRPPPPRQEATGDEPDCCQPTLQGDDRHLPTLQNHEASNKDSYQLVARMLLTSLVTGTSPYTCPAMEAGEHLCRGAGGRLPRARACVHRHRGALERRLRRRVAEWRLVVRCCWRGVEWCRSKASVGAEAVGRESVGVHGRHVRVRRLRVRGLRRHCRVEEGVESLRLKRAVRARRCAVQRVHR